MITYHNALINLGKRNLSSRILLPGSMAGKAMIDDRGHENRWSMVDMGNLPGWFSTHHQSSRYHRRIIVPPAIAD